MIAESTQRWTSGRDSYRPAGEPIDPRRYEVAYLPADNVAKGFIVEHHYSGSVPPARFRYGLFCQGELVGVAWFAVPQNPATYKGLPGEPSESVDLGRFVLLDRVPANGETWFLARTFDDLMRRGIVTVVSFSDPARRTNIHGETVFGGHVGTIYQAHNAAYLGRSKSETKWVLPDGRILCNRSMTKIRKYDQGWQYAAALLERHGAAPLLEGDDAPSWVARWRAALCRPIRHPGNHKYAWVLPRRARRHLPPSLPYPKLALAA